MGVRNGLRIFLHKKSLFLQLKSPFHARNPIGTPSEGCTLKKAIKDIDRVLQMQPHFAPAYQARAFSLSKLGKSEEANQWFQKFREVQAKARQ